MPRDTAGNYTLPAGNPVASGEIIAASWANSTMNDLGQSLSASLDRYGRGGMLAPFQFTDGTESAPGATWSNEPTTGLYRAAYGDLRFTLTGTDVQRWTNANSYLWRNSQWEEILTQTGGGGSTTINNLVVTGSFTSPGIDDNATSTAITIDAAENVGIGETDPSGYWTQASDLVVASTSNGGMTIKTPATGSGRLAFTDTKSATAGLTDGGLLSYEHTSDSMTFGTAGVQRAVIDGSGNVGIGTLTPTEKLSISGSTSPVRVRTEATTGSSGLRTSNTGGNFIFEIDNSVASAFGKGAYSRNVYADGAYPMVFWTNGNERMRIDASGNVGIGTDSPVSAGSTFGSVTASGSAGGEYYVATGGTAKGNFFNYTADVNQVGLAAVDPAGELVFSTGGYNERMRLDASGNVGIGYVSAYNNARLTVAGPSSVGTANSHIALVGDGGVGVGNGPQILFSDSGAGADFAGGTIGFERTGSNSIGDLVFGTRRITGTSTTPTTEVMRITSNSHVEVANGAKLYLKSSAAPSPYMVEDNNAWTVNTGSAERMRIDSSGNVGIGTGSPNGKFDVKTGNAGFELWPEYALDTNLIINFDRTSSSYQNLQVRAASHQFLIDATEKMRIDSSGHLGIGESNPVEALTIINGTMAASNTTSPLTTPSHLFLTGIGNGDGFVNIDMGAQVSSTPYARISTEIDNAAGSTLLFHTSNNFGAMPTERMRIDESGNVLVGTASQPNGSADGIKFNAASSGRVLSGGTTGGFNQVLFYNPNGQVGSITTLGSATSYNVSSDERLKENIVDAPAGNLDALKVRSFDWKADGEHQDYGFIAQELETVAPYAVTKGETDEDMWAVDYSKLVPMLVKEIQDLKAEVAALKGA